MQDTNKLQRGNTKRVSVMGAAAASVGSMSSKGGRGYK